jgi:GNAT superfamily N-acetyltransferase
MRYRPAISADAPLLAAMNYRLIRDEGHRNPMSLDQLEQRMRSWLAGEYQAILFEDDTGAAGYALFKREPEWVYLRQFFVVPERRRAGVGRTAIHWLLKEAWPDALRVRLDVLVNNPAGLAFWRSVGFADYCITMEKNGT